MLIKHVRERFSPLQFFESSDLDKIEPENQSQIQVKMKTSYVRSEHNRYQNDVIETMTNKFMELWKSGHSASYNINCRNGEAWLNFSTYLGYQESDNHSSFENRETKSPKRPRSSPSKLKRNKRRLEAFQEKKRLDASQQSHSQTSNFSKEKSEKSLTNSRMDNPDNGQQSEPEAPTHLHEWVA